jgi:ElaB/YqjD/DUF883 family membrane-anchored ribosome-binding protein
MAQTIDTGTSAMNEGLNTARQVVAGAAEELSGQLDAARERMESLDEQVRELTRAHPFVAIGCAVALGYVAGRLISRH